MMIQKFEHYIDNKVVSSLILYIVGLPSRKLAVIEEVFTVEEFRGQGLATSLLKQAIEKADKENCTCVELTVRQDKPEVQELYRKLGFKDRENLSFRLNLHYHAL